jgi:glutamate dehydrogenase/leucine dehydrogenase
MTIDFEFADDLGPGKVIEIYEPSCELRAILVVDNVAAGPAIGGVRMAADVTREECFRLARAMSLKNAMAGLAHGGGKAAIVADPNLPVDDKTRLVRSFAHSIRDVFDYIPGPDMGTNETYMAHVKDVTGRAVGLPRSIGGIPLDEIGATGLGVAIALEEAQRHVEFDLAGARVVIEGFGSVGQHAARFLAERGSRVVGVADSRGARACAEGFDLGGLLAHKQNGHSVADFSEGESLDVADLVALDCDVWIPAARPDVIRMDNVQRMRTKVIVQGANIPATAEAEAWLADNGVLVIPDFVANAGGVICAAVEYHGGTQSQALSAIEEKIRANVDAVLTRSRTEQELPRRIALQIARERIREAMSYRQC